jgi:hypothetical protein
MTEKDAFKNYSGLFVVLMWLVTIPVVWISCALVCIYIHNVYALLYATVATLIIIFVPMIKYGDN